MTSGPAGLCECGCGESTPIATRNRFAIGHIKGQPIRFIQGHKARAHVAAARARNEVALAALTGDGLCLCGCGESAPIAQVTMRSRGYVKGQPQKFIKGHATTRLERTPCAADGCEALITADYCPKHETRLRRHGTLTGKRLMGTAEQRFWGYVTKADGCWPWGGSLADTGYGVHWTDEKHLVGAHRYAYELLVGPMPEGLTLDHVCHTLDKACVPADCLHRRCVNPAHLEPVTQAENNRRARTRAA